MKIYYNGLILENRKKKTETYDLAMQTIEEFEFDMLRNREIIPTFWELFHKNALEKRVMVLFKKYLKSCKNIDDNDMRIKVIDWENGTIKLNSE